MTGFDHHEVALLVTVGLISSGAESNTQRVVTIAGRGRRVSRCCPGVAFGTTFPRMKTLARALRGVRRRVAKSMASVAVTVAMVGVSALPASAAASGWTRQAIPNNPNLFSVSCWAANGCMAVGGTAAFPYKTAAERWNGLSWTRLSTPSLVSSIGTSKLVSISCWAANGCFALENQNDATASNRIQRWNGSSWRVASTLPRQVGLRDVACRSASSCMIVGYFFTKTGTGYSTTYHQHPYAQRWNGSRWATLQVPTPAGYGYLESVSCSGVTCIAVGGTNSSRTWAAHWNGSTWRALNTYNPPGGGTLFGVSCWASTGCIAVGADSGYGGVSVAQRWNGRAWSPLRTPVLDGSGLYSVSCLSAVACTAGGGFPYREKALAERWNGKTWTKQDLAGANTGVYWDVACRTATSCEAVGGGGAASWSP